MWRPAGRKTRVGTLTEDNCDSGGTIANFFAWWFSEVNGIQTEGSESPDVEATKKCPYLAACASLWREPSLFRDDTHAVVALPKCAPEHELHTQRGPVRWWVASLAHRRVLEKGARLQSGNAVVTATVAVPMAEETPACLPDICQGK